MKQINPRHILYFLLALAAVLLPVWALPKISTWFPNLSQSQLNVVEALFSATPALLLFIGNVIYNHSETVYFSVNRAALWLTNKSVSWTMFIELEQERKQGVIEEVKSRLFEQYPETKIWTNEESKKTFKIPYPIAASLLIKELNSEDDSGFETTQIVIELSDFVVPFRHSLDSIEAITLLINNCVIDTTATSLNSKYIFKINFEEQNPYFGLFVRQLRVPQKQLVHFECIFNDQVGQANGTIQVSNSKLSLTTDNLANLQILSRRYITLATLDLANN